MIISGIHHITAICGSPQANIDFYAETLGLRLVKVTVNFDDPGSYHLYYGNALGAPGTCLTFFAWPRGERGLPGAGQATKIVFSVPPGSTGFWRSRLDTAGLAFLHAEGDAPRTSFKDPDGISVDLIETYDDREPWVAEGLDEASAIRGFHSVDLSITRTEATERVLEKMGFIRHSGVAGSMSLKNSFPGRLVQLVRSSEPAAGGVGTIHHVAFATPTEDTQAQCAREIQEFGLKPTPVQERQYFRSIYFRESSGVLFEVATAGPGFDIDEPAESLGTRLCLPEWLEKFRTQIEQAVPKIRTPGGATIPA